MNKILKSTKPAVALVLCVLVAGSAGLAAKEPRFPVLTPGQPQEGMLRPGTEDGRYRTFLLDVPKTASAIRVRLTSSGADLDLYLNHGSEMDDYNEADFASESDIWLEELLLHRVYEAWFPSGRYYLDVAYNWDEMPRENGAVIDSIPFTLEYEIFDAGQTAGTLAAGEPADFELSETTGYMAHFRLELPRPAAGFRVDVLDTPGDIDLFLSAGESAPVRDGYLVSSETYLGRESLKVTADLLRGSAGPYYLTVLEATMSEYPVPVRLLLSAGTSPPASAPVLPELPANAAGLDLARLATVQLVSPAGIGSGCLVSGDGLILTNEHVILDDGGRQVSEVVVAMALNAYEAPLELFTAEVIGRSPENDLALLRVKGDRWGRSLPRGYRFPAWEIGDPESLNIGDTLVLMGYPWMGSGLSRSYLTLTRGVLSGGEHTPSGLTLKTDAVISGGSSGGAVSDGGWRLLGLPTFVVSQDAAQLTYFVPVSRIPGDWRRMIGK